MGTAGQIQAGQAQAASYEYQAKVADANAQIADRKAKEILEAGKLEEQKQRRETAQLMGQQQASMAANGVDISFGSPLDLLVDTATMGELDALTIRANTYRDERDVRQQAMNERASAGMNRSAASSARAGGYMAGAGTLLGGAAKSYTAGVNAGIW